MQPQKLISYTNPDSSTNAYSVFNPQPKLEEANKLILILPAMGVEAAYYEPFAADFAKLGITAITADLRGHGHSNIRPSKNINFGYNEIINLDLATLFKSIKSKYPEKQIYLLGHSLGGQLGSLHLSSLSNWASGLILIASCSVYYKGWEGVAKYKLLLQTQFAGVLVRFLGYFPGKKIGFAGLEAKQQMIDWSYQARTGLYKPKGAKIDYEKSLKNLKLATLAITIKGDDFSPYKATQLLYQKFHPELKVEHWQLGAKELAYKSPGHFNWARKSQNISRLIKDWIEANSI